MVAFARCDHVRVELKDIIGLSLTAITTLITVLTYIDGRRSRADSPKALRPSTGALAIVLIVATLCYWVWRLV